MERRGFTLIELLVVLLILGILVGLSAKGLRAARLNAKRAQAMVEIKSIETAAKAYANKYGKPPMPEASLGDEDFGATEEQSRAILEILVAENVDANPAKIVFLEPKSAEEPAAFLDPWGEAYRIVLDGNFDGSVELEGETIRRRVAIVSIGLRELKESADPADLIASWR